MKKFNHAYMNIVEQTRGKRPTNVLRDINIELSLAIDLIINKDGMHSSIIKIKDSLNSPTCFVLNKVNVQGTEKLIKTIRVHKASG